jgi:hypothetical protein
MVTRGEKAEPAVPVCDFRSSCCGRNPQAASDAVTFIFLFVLAVLSTDLVKGVFGC